MAFFVTQLQFDSRSLGSLVTSNLSFCVTIHTLLYLYTAGEAMTVADTSERISDLFPV